ncbi:DNA (cytosine-5-)-methyltransferase [Nitriliruptoraceae bacterium ZYF776]|nr:DNA (cytosine-5-)-methyltransferase [Profundirhabdus halotolerans]
MSNRPLRVVELFAGVGGFRLGLEREYRGFDPVSGFRWERPEERDWQVVWANQWEPSTKAQPAADNYRFRLEEEAERFGDDGALLVNEDIARVLDDELGVDGGPPRDPGAHGFPEDFDLLVGGFPCQDYSVAKPLSQASGIEGVKGVLWWEIHRILEHRRPPHVLLENVDRLLKSPSTQRGRDFAVMLACFARLGYRVEWRVVNAADHGFPQRRRRVFIYATLADDGLHLDESRAHDAIRFEADVSSWGLDVATETGVLANALRCDPRGAGSFVALSPTDDPADVDPFYVSQWFGRDEAGRAAKTSPFRSAGVMSHGAVWTLDVEVPASEREDRLALADVLQPLEQVVAEHPEVLIPTAQLDFSAEPSRSTWNYLKGSKREERVKPGGFTYFYTEGAVAFPEPDDQPARTVLTGEGGRSPSRFKLVVRQQTDDEDLVAELHGQSEEAFLASDGDGPSFEVFRRLTPVELERLDMFPDGWTEPIGDGRVMAPTKRAFCVGNALVVGVVHRIGVELAERIRTAEASEGSRSLRAV